MNQIFGACLRGIRCILVLKSHDICTSSNDSIFNRHSFSGIPWTVLLSIPKDTLQVVRPWTRPDQSHHIAITTPLSIHGLEVEDTINTEVHHLTWAAIIVESSENYQNTCSAFTRNFREKILKASAQLPFPLITMFKKLFISTPHAFNFIKFPLWEFKTK